MIQNILRVLGVEYALHQQLPDKGQQREHGLQVFSRQCALELRCGQQAQHGLERAQRVPDVVQVDAPPHVARALELVHGAHAQRGVQLGPRGVAHAAREERVHEGVEHGRAPVRLDGDGPARDPLRDGVEIRLRDAVQGAAERAGHARAVDRDGPRPPRRGDGGGGVWRGGGRRQLGGHGAAAGGRRVRPGRAGAVPLNGQK